MKKLNILNYIFTIIGVGMLLGTFFIYKNTSIFLETAIITHGTVIGLLENRGSRNLIHYKPLIEFIDKNGKRIEFSSSSSTNPLSYNVGEKIEILYNPKSPNDAEIKGFFSIWGGTIMLGVAGLIFFSIGVLSFISKKVVIQIYKRNRDDHRI